MFLQSVLDSIQCSKLNFKICLSPFSASICLKKSFIKDKDGISLQPSKIVNSSEVYAGKIELEAKLENTLLDCAEMIEKNKSLENKYSELLKKYSVKLEENSIEVKTLEKNVQNLEEEIDYLQLSNKSKEKSIADEVLLLKANTKKDILDIEKKIKMYTQYWRKVLRMERSLR